MRIAVVGGGINGVMCAASLGSGGHDVMLLERSTLMSATSSASTKLLHGGLRYLEHGSFRLVREALHERRWWLDQAPQFCHPLQLLLPVWRGQGRSRHLIRAGLWMYDLLAGSARLHPHRWLDRSEALAVLPGLRSDGLVGAFSFWDGQMDDRALGLWAAERARSLGVQIRERAPVEHVAIDGVLEGPGMRERFDRVVNCSGPWAEDLLRRSGITPRHTLDLVRGSHLVVDRPLATGVLAQVHGESRIAFLLPWKGRMLVGTTEVRQGLEDPISCSGEETDYLRRFHDSVMLEPLRSSEVSSTFAGVRPLIRSADDPGRATREYALERHGALLTVFGGKWTTARALGELVASRIA